MARRYHRRHRYTVARPLKTTKYSNETYCSQFLLKDDSGNQGSRAMFALAVVPNNTNGVLGTRKVKNFTLRMVADPTQYTHDGTTANFRSRVAFALVYVPEGTTASVMQFGAGSSAVSMYEPNQNVIMSGIIDSTQAYSFKTRLARNLNAGDQIALVLLDLTLVNVSGDTYVTPVTATCNYAISF